MHLTPLLNLKFLKKSPCLEVFQPIPLKQLVFRHHHVFVPALPHKARFLVILAKNALKNAGFFGGILAHVFR